MAIKDKHGKLIKGTPSLNPAGRPIGGPDVRREFKALKELLLEKNFDPREVLIELASHKKSSIRLQASKILTERIDPALKHMEHAGKITLDHDITEIKGVMKDILEANKKEY